ncbi:hypothetical protein KGF56_000719 [Candida oxycetoniae]|uniref:Uncharacterized protein n=1 Tax=Candida oxycetoniae TaxID=497107 RepID=A0AAI9T1B1_9ASCO|nr:uncharacterized protein KGF56_000719 [Candida oxycetoniae]KAI3406587.2 hypothetical protein KGF56_000719 [Candida oxycetoniae]
MLLVTMNLHHFMSLLQDDMYLNESLLSEKEFVITSLPPLYLVSKISKGKYTSSEVTAAFIKKYLIIHNIVALSQQLERHMTEALAMARFLDCYYADTGNKVIGPLHGLPISETQLDTVKQLLDFEGDILGNVKLNLFQYDLESNVEGAVSPRSKHASIYPTISLQARC